MPLSPHLDVSDGVKTVQLVQQLQHCTLNLPLTTAVCVVSLRANRVNLICTGLKGQNAQSTGWGMGSARGREGNTAGVGTSKRSVNGLRNGECKRQRGALTQEILGPGFYDLLRSYQQCVSLDIKMHAPIFLAA